MYNIKLRIIGLLGPKILAMYVPVAYGKRAKDVKAFFKDVFRLVDKMGLEWTVKYVKSTRLAVTRYLSGHPLHSIEGVALKDGFPLWISNWKDALQDKDELRILMTLLVALRGFTFKPKLDTSTITEPFSGKDTISESELKAAMYALKVTRKDVRFSFPHMSTKRGPAGQALLTSISEVNLLPRQLLDDIILIGGSKLAKLLEGLTDRLDILGWSSVADIWAKEFPPKTRSLRRLSYFSDKEGKTRVIGILDYWTQTALKPLHNSLNGILKGIKTDCTFNQNRFLEVLPSSGPYYSLDLHAATDRMPISVQERVISFVVGADRAKAWSRLLTSMEFSIADQPGVSVKYQAGQPMGAYSSWPAMALTHHALVRISARRAGKTVFFERYVILGDDLVIADSRVAEEYKKLCGELDMPISEAKTHVSEDTYEFAKRWVYKGTEVTGFALSGLLSVWKRYPLLHNFLETQSHHGWCLPVEGHPGLIAAIYKVFRGPRFIAEHMERVVSLYMVFDSVSKEIKAGSYDQVRVFATLKERFSLDVLSAVPHLEPCEILKWIFTVAKKRLIERDVYQFQSDAYKVNDRLYKIAFKQIPGSADQATQDFMRETIPVMVNWDNPLVLCLNRLIDESLILLMHVLDETADKSEFYQKAGLSKYFISKGVFTMRASHSITLADSAVNKFFISAAADLIAQKWTVESMIAEKEKLINNSG
nr:MAG: putative RNA-dependent RNA polymerase [Mitoviridae sp.]